LKKILAFLSLSAAMASAVAFADPTTVCTITVNSPDEKEVLRRNLPSDKFQFVELVERGRSDWLASACRKGVRCDVLVISGHFDGGDVFYSDRVDARESLPVDEMQRVSCSDSCPGLFSQLKEVYLFGCNTLNADMVESAADIARNLVRSGHPAADADPLSRALRERHADSNRDRMRQIFKDVPVIYGFSSKAPLGAHAGPVLERYFQTAAGGETGIGTGRPNARLQTLFASSSMTIVPGLRDGDPDAAHRGDVCRFFDERQGPPQKIAFVHELLKRNVVEATMFLDHIERYSASLEASERSTPAVSAALDAIAHDQAARTRFLDYERHVDSPSVRVRMIGLAHRFGWLSAAQKRSELARMIGDRLARDAIGTSEVDLVCALNSDHDLDHELPHVQAAAVRSAKLSHVAVLACLGSADARTRVMAALTSPRDEEVQIAQVYLRHRPVDDVSELRLLATGIARMTDAAAQVRALDTLARHRLSDLASLDALARLFPLARTVAVQRAIAGILIRADYPASAKPDLVRALRTHRIKSPDGEDMIDVLIRRWQSS
jgi:hypothetical protein